MIHLTIRKSHSDMNLGLDILDAVRKGGINNWQPIKSDSPNLQKARGKIQRQTEEAIADLLNAMGNEVWTTDNLAKKLGWRRERANKWLLELVAQKRIKRSTVKQPHRFWKA